MKNKENSVKPPRKRLVPSFSAKVSGGRLHTVGLKEAGTVAAAGYNEYGRCNVSGWDLWK